MYILDPYTAMYQTVVVTTIQVIDPPKESYDEYHERMKKEEGRKRMPFGFGIREETE